MNENKRSRFIVYFLGALQVFIGLTAIAGGFGLVSDPSGTKLNIPLDWLSNSPFTNYFVPGLVLLIVNGAGNFLAGIVTFLLNRYAGNIAVAFGIFWSTYFITTFVFNTWTDRIDVRLEVAQISLHHTFSSSRGGY
jgi:hypothetical protein